METIGLIAGNGKFPLLFAREARRQNMRVVPRRFVGTPPFLLNFLLMKSDGLKLENSKNSSLFLKIAV